MADLFSLAGFPDEDSGNRNDGPYVLYQGGNVLVRSIHPEKGIPKSTIQTFAEKEKVEVPVKVSFSDHPDWDFSVKLQPVLKNEPSEFKQPEKLLALSDIEGEFEELRKLLVANKVIDSKYNWIFSTGHVVICGDLFDRGSDVVAVIWLLYKLEQDAKAKGGYLHTILGNHDIINLSGDLRYVMPKYFINAKLMGVDYMTLYGVDSELGRWLRSKNLIEKIGDNLCLHAGMAPEINKLKISVKEINERCRPYYDKVKQPDLFVDKAIWKLFEEAQSSLFWYRGYFQEPKASLEEVEETLSLYQVNRIIVGHTITETNVGFYYNGSVLGIDTNQHKGKLEGALYEAGKWYKVNERGVKSRIGD